MIKRILVALDPDSDTMVAIRYAVEIATRHGAEVTGLTVVDTRYRGTAGGIGSVYYQEKTREHSIEESRKKARELSDAFAATLQDSGIPFQTSTEEGAPFERIVEEMLYYDLLLVGRGTHFSYSRPAEDTHTVERVMKKAITATLIVDKTYRPIRNVLVAYDGSLEAALALQRFAQLEPFGMEPVLYLLHVHDGDRAASELLLRKAAEYLEAHAIRIDGLNTLAGNPEDEIISYTQGHQIDLIIMGARFVSKIRELTFGSTTSAVLNHAPASLFLEG